ncbi:hypothetical protein [Parafrankia elaeagni]|uniref:hypothetical protein n=1 Tax=Parafrankia elaeagni TaxID=222534 RepID=UPI000365EC6B|nr:hypothetical protein [Parafrankia elaeagni]
MPVTVVRPETGAVIRPGPMVTVSPLREVAEDDYGDLARDTGLHGPFLADQLSAFVAHERKRVSLLRTLRARADNPGLRSRYGELESETFQAIGIWERLIESLGGNPQYASPAGRAVEGLDTKTTEALLLSGSADPETFDQAGLRAFAAAATQSGLNVRLLAALARGADKGTSRDLLESAVRELEPTAHGHADWAGEKLEKVAISHAKHSAVRKVAQAAERMTAKARSVLGGDRDG